MDPTEQDDRGSGPPEPGDRDRRRRALIELVVFWGGSVTLVLLNMWSGFVQTFLEDWVGVPRAVVDQWLALTAIVLLLFSLFAARRWAELERVIDEQRETARELRRSRERFRRLVESSPAIVSLIDPRKGEVEWMNERVEEVLGYERDPLVGSDPSVILGPDRFRSLLEGIRDAEPGAVVGPVDAEAETADGDVRLLELYGSPLETADGDVRKVVVYGTDVTRRELSQHQLEDALERERLIVDILGHDLKNQLAGASTRLDLLTREHPEASDEAEQVHESIEDLARTLEEVVWYLRMEKEGIEFSPRNLSGLVRKGVESAVDAAGVDPDRVEVDAPEDLTWRASPVLERAVVNLVVNALEWGPEDEAVEVRVESDGVARIEVVDRGPGVDVDDPAVIFKRFGGEGSDEDEGPGLGLAIVDRVVELHGGVVDVEETPGGGATFVIELPPDPGSGTPDNLDALLEGAPTGSRASASSDGGAAPRLRPSAGPSPSEGPDLEGPGADPAVDADEIAEAEAQEVIETESARDPSALADHIFHRWVDTGVHELRQALAMVRARLAEADRTEEEWEAAAQDIRERVDLCETLLSTLFSEEEARRRLIQLDLEPVDVGEHLASLLARVPSAPAPDLDPDVPLARADPERLDDVLTHLARQIIERREGSGDVVVDVWSEDGQVGGFIGLPDDAVSRSELVEAVSLPFEVDGMGIDLPYCRAVFSRHGGELFVTTRGNATGFGFTLPRAQEVKA